jgi:CHASE1-domain containing sensor protein
MEFLTSPTFGVVLRVLGVFATVGAGYLAYRYFKQAGGEQAQTRLNALNKDTISALESRIRLLQTTIEDLEKALKRTGADLTRALERVKELIEEQEMVG